MSSQTIRVLALGDLVGRPGRRIVRERLKLVREQQRLDFVIINVENATNGAGTRPKDAEELLAAGADCLTNGDHVFDHAEYLPYLDVEPRCLRPCNYATRGSGARVYKTAGGHSIGVVNVAGTTFMKAIPDTANPFQAIGAEIHELRRQTKLIFVDIHGEATSEKIAMGWMLDGRVSAVFGSHTHVQTSDAQVLPQGTGYLTDLGMTGPHRGVIGRDIESVIKRFVSGEKQHMQVAKGWLRMSGAIFEVNVESGLCVKVELFTHELEGVDE